MGHLVHMLLFKGCIILPSPKWSRHWPRYGFQWSPDMAWALQWGRAASGPSLGGKGLTVTIKKPTNQKPLALAGWLAWLERRRLCQRLQVCWPVGAQVVGSIPGQDM